MSTLRWLRHAFASGLFAAASLSACTIFVMTDGERTLFFNNEDWFNPATRVWFVPAGEGHLGCAYVGFDDEWAQGGVNSAGLAFDWVSGYPDPYAPDPALVPVRGNPSERMLESCTTVEEAMAFYRRHLEPDFARARILIADRSGASVVIGSRDGNIHMEPLKQSRGFGYGGATVERELAKSPPTSLDTGREILRACVMPGEGGTKYACVYDLGTGEMVLYPDPRREEPVRLELQAELARGAHYYELSRLRDDVAGALRPLPPNMRRFHLDAFTPVPDPRPEEAARLRRVLEEAAAGAMQAEDYAPDFWQMLSPHRAEVAADIARFGEVHSLVLVERQETDEGVTCLHIVDCAHSRILIRSGWDAAGRLTVIKTEFVERKASWRR